MYSAAPAWLVICDEARPLLAGWQCLFEPTFHDDLLVVIDRIPGLAVLRVHLPPRADEFFRENVPAGGTRYLFPTAEDVEPVAHPVFEVELREDDFATLDALRPTSTPEEDRYARDGIWITTMCWQDGRAECVEGCPPHGDHLRLVEHLLNLAGTLREPEVDRRIEGIRRYVR